jgi:hypothetical protein
LRWYRELITDKYNGAAKRGAGRPRMTESLREMILRFEKENSGWGYTRLRGALRNLGHVVGRNTIKRILKDHGIQPAPERSKRMPRSTFLKAHFGVLAATDFYSVEVLIWVGLVRYYVLFVIDIQTRRVHIAGIEQQPNGAWMKQVARNITDGVDGFLKGCGI